MNDSTVIFLEASTNFTTSSNGILDSVSICVYIISSLFGLPTHSYVIWLIITGTGSGVTSEFFILNLSVCEIGIYLNCFVYAISYWSLSHPALELFFLGFTITGRPLFQSLICVERYLAVVHPVTFFKYKPLRYRVICCTVAWIICFGSYFVCMYTLGKEDNHLYVCFFSLQFLVFFSIQLFCLVAVLRALKQSGPGERKIEGGNHMKSILSLSNNYCKHGYHIWSKFDHKIFYHCDKTVYSTTLIYWFYLLCAGWFCAASSVHAPHWKTLLSLFAIIFSSVIF